jgi:hypothetical protein
MVAIALIGLLLGATVSLRFALLVVLPAVALTWLFDSGTGAQQVSERAILLNTALCLGALQLGHLAGVAARTLLPLDRD